MRAFYRSVDFSTKDQDLFVFNNRNPHYKSFHYYLLLNETISCMPRLHLNTIYFKAI